MTGLLTRGAWLGAAVVAALSFAGVLTASAPADTAFAHEEPERGLLQTMHYFRWFAPIAYDGAPEASTGAGPGAANTPSVSELAESEAEPVVEVVTPLPVAAPADGCPPVVFQALGRAGCMISFCESMWNPGATGASGEMGYFQINPRWHADATYDPAGNVAAAVRISHGGSNWSAWTVRSVLSTGVCPSGVWYPG